MSECEPGSTRNWLLALGGAALLATAFASLGNWQWARAQQKEALRERIEGLEQQPRIVLAAAPADADILDWRRVTARGAWVPEKTVLIDNKMYHGVAGYHVVTPLKLNGAAMHVLVNRGWVAAPRLRSELPRVPTPRGEIEVAGVARKPSERFIELSGATREGAVWENLTIERFRAWAQVELQPVLIRQTSPADDGLTRDWDAPDTNATKHRMIAFQWYALALVVPAVSLAFAIRRRKKEGHSGEA